MGKNLIQQARGKGGPTYRAPSFRYRGGAAHKSFSRIASAENGIIVDLLDCPGDSAPLSVVQFDDGEKVLNIAPEGVSVGQSVQSGFDAEVKIGNVCLLRNIPVGTLIYNIESKPGHGGKFVRSSGTFAR